MRRERAFVANGQFGLFALSINYPFEVDHWLVTPHDRLPTGAHYRIGDPPRLSQDAELGVDVLVELWEELEPDIGRYPWGYLAFWFEVDLEVVLSHICGTRMFSGRGSTLNELKAFDTLVRVMTW